MRADATPLSVRPTDGLEALVTVGAFGMNDRFAPPIWSFAAPDTKVRKADEADIPVFNL